MAEDQRLQRFARYLELRNVSENHPAYDQFVQYHLYLSEVRGRELYEVLQSLVELRGKKVLDIGSGAGALLDFLASLGCEAYGLEIDAGLCRCSSDTQQLAIGTATRLPFHDEVFEVVLAVDLIEHVLDQRAALRGMLATVRPGGVLVLVANNRLLPWDTHSHLPFISWLPRWLADKYARLFKREYDVQLPTWWGFRTLAGRLDGVASARMVGSYTIWGFYNWRFGRLKVVGRWIQVLADKVTLLQWLAPKLVLAIEKERKTR